MANVRGPLEDMTNLATSMPEEPKLDTMAASKTPGHGHRKSLSQGIMTSPVGKGIHKVMEATGKLVRGSRRSLTQEELDAEIENYGSLGA